MKTESEQDRFYRLSNSILELLLSAITSETACNFARRIAVLSRSRWIPSSGFGDLSLIAFLLNKSERTIEDTIRDRQIKPRKTGKEHIYSLVELVESSSGKSTFRKPRGKLKQKILRAQKEQLQQNQ